MWPFGGKKKTIDQIFRGLVSEQFLRALASEQPLRAPPAERKKTGFIIFNVRETTMDEVKLGLETACKELIDRGYVLESLACSIGLASNWGQWEGVADLEETANGLVRIMGPTV